MRSATSSTSPTNAAGTQLVVAQFAQYDSRGQLISLDYQNAAGQHIAHYAYGYDPVGRLTSQSDQADVAALTYDGVGQILAVTHTAQANESYSWDANGNQTGSGVVLGPMNEVLADGTFSYQYDLAGNLIQKTNISGGDYKTYHYDFRNRLTQVDEYSPGGVLTGSTSYTYDIFDRRVAMTVNGLTTRHAYDRPNAWADFNADGSVAARYLFGSSVDHLLARVRPGSGVAFYLTDRLGTVRDIVSSVGQVINHIVYDSFGIVLSQTNQSAGDRFLFQGREFDFTTGLYFFRERQYDPALHRFTSQDPTSFLGGDSNLYRFAANSPTNARDPFGLASAKEEAGFLSRIIAKIQKLYNKFKVPCRIVNIILLVGFPLFSIGVLGRLPDPTQSYALWMAYLQAYQTQRTIKLICDPKKQPPNIPGL